jgi:hypothetical protein
MHRFSALVAASIVGCAPQADRLPVQEPEQVAAAIVEAVRACTAGLTPTGAIDQAAMAASGWRVVRRSTRFEAESRELAVNAHPTLRPGEYEATEWVREGVPNRIELIRSDGTPGGLHDVCDVAARTASRAAAERVVAAIAGHFGRRPDRRGAQPRGGDFLTPRSDSEQIAHYWALPNNDAYVTIGDDGHVRLEVLAMADRATLDRNSPDRPEHRIPAEGPS